MFTPGNILHGKFDLGTEKKEKFAIVLYNDGVDCILTTFTTSLERSTVLNPCHGKNPVDGEAKSYVFKSKTEIGKNNVEISTKNRNSCHSEPSVYRTLITSYIN